MCFWQLYEDLSLLIENASGSVYLKHHGHHVHLGKIQGQDLITAPFLQTQHHVYAIVCAELV